MSDESGFLRRLQDQPDDSDRPPPPEGADTGDEPGFLRRLQEVPDDDETRQVYADWLEERGDPRAEYLRLERLLLTIPQRLAQLREGIDPEWLAVVGRPKSRRVELVRYPPMHKSNTIEIILKVTRMNVREAGELVSGPLPATIKDDVAIDEAVRIWRLFDGIAEVAIKPRWEYYPSTDPATALAPPMSGGQVPTAGDPPPPPSL